MAPHRLRRRCRRFANLALLVALVLWIATPLVLRDMSIGGGAGAIASSFNLTEFCRTLAETLGAAVVGSADEDAGPGGPYSVPAKFDKYLAPAPTPTQRINGTGPGGANVTGQQGTGTTPRDIADAVYLANAVQVIHNEDVFGPVTNETIVIAIQVHARGEYLKHLIVSFAGAKGIEDVLLIFSHDLYDAEMNEIVSRIDFCRYTQIFFPVSIQIHPEEFPGDDPRDCPPDIKPPDAEKLGCLNAKWPDKYGHYRRGKTSQIKHHWWWKAWYLFEGGFKALEGFTGDVIFLEEDHWVVEDFLHVFHLLKAEAKAQCPECVIMSLGNQVKKQERAGNQVEISRWIASKHNMGMVLGRDSWRVIAGCAREFCLFDDYNWDWSLMYVGMTCTNPRLMTLNLKSSRVFHIGECGLHHQKKNCDVGPVLRRAEAQVKSYSELYPKSLSFRRVTYNIKVPKGNGGWGDYRDRALCLNLTKMGGSS